MAWKFAQNITINQCLCQWKSDNIAAWLTNCLAEWQTERVIVWFCCGMLWDKRVSAVWNTKIHTDTHRNKIRNKQDKNLHNITACFTQNEIYEFFGHVKNFIHLWHEYYQQQIFEIFRYDDNKTRKRQTHVHQRQHNKTIENTKSTYHILH